MRVVYAYLAAALHTLLVLARPAHAAETEVVAPARTLEFIENKGQWDARSRYEADLRGGRLFLESTGLRLVLGQPADRPGHEKKTSATPPPAHGLVPAHALELEFVGAAPARLRADEQTDEHRSYFIGADPARWASDVRSYRQVRYDGLWPGVAARVYENAGQQLEYDFELAAGADAGLVAIRHHGADALRLDAEGNLLVQTSVGTLTERAPQAWQTDAQGRRQLVSCRYVLQHNVLRFDLGRYDHRRPLTIDPVVIFSTYSGATSTNWGFTATHDRQGNLYSGGIVFTFGFPVTTGAFQTTFRGQTDMALTKYDVTRNGAASRVWATLIGGDDWDFPHSLVVNNQGELLVLGSSSSTSYPTTTGAIQRQFGGGTPADPFGNGSIFSNNYEVTYGTDLVVSRLSATGTALRSSTYLGGDGNDGLVPLSPNATAVQLPHNYGDPFRGDIVVDAQDNVYIASSTTGSFPARASFNTLYRGGPSDGLVCKLTPGLTSVLWAGLLGGTGADAAYSLQLAPGSGDVYVTGGTLSPNFPTTPGSYRPTRPGNVDGFVARIAADGSRIVRATYLGTTNYDQAYFLQLGTDGGVYVLGQTVGSYPTTPGLYRTPNGTQFIHKLDANLGTTQLATVFGNGSGEVNISPTAFLVDQCDRVFVCGWGGSNNADSNKAYLELNGSTAGMPTTPDALQRVTDGEDFYLAQFTAGLTSLGYATHYGSFGGGDHVDGGTSRFDPRGVVYQAVCACFAPTGFPIPPGANSFSTTNGSPTGCNNAAFVFDFQPAIAGAGGDQTVCATAAPLALAGTPTGGIWSGPGVSGSVATGFYFTPSPNLLGVQNLIYTVVGTGLCTTTAGRRVTVVASPVVAFNLPQTSFCITSAFPAAIRLSGTPAGGTFTGEGVRGSVAAGFTFDPTLLSSTGTYPLTYTYTVPGCTSQVSRTVSVLRADAGRRQTVCRITSPFALQGAPAGGTWSGPGVSGSAATGFVFTPATAPAGSHTLRYAVADPVSGCISESSRIVEVLTVAPVAVTPVPIRCTTDTAPVVLQGSPGGGSWAGPGVYTNGGTYFLSPSAQAGTVTLRYTMPSLFCPQEATLAVTTLARPQPALPADTTLCPGSTRPFGLRGSPAGGTWSGPGVSGTAATGYVFTPAPGFTGAALLYTVANGSCPGTATRRVSVATEPDLLAAWTPAACAQDRQAPLVVRFTAPVVPGTLSWEFGDNSPAATGFSVTHTYTGAGRYQPRATLRYFDSRCVVQVALAPVEVQDEPIPNIITPGTDDQLNHAFRLPPGCPPRLQLFSRWGQRVFEAAAYQNNWSAQDQPGGLYYYLLEYPDGHRVRGWLEVIK